MVGSGQDWEESIGSQRQDQFLNLEQKRDTTHTSRSQSRGGSYISHGENTKSTQLEIDHLPRRLTIFPGGYTASDREGIPQILIPPLMIMEMVAIGPSPGHLPMSLFRTGRTIITNGEVRVHLTKVRAMML